MRPKIVILVIVTAFGLLGLIALLKGVTGKNAGAGSAQVSDIPASTNTPFADGNSKVALYSGPSNTVAVSEELRAVVVEKEVEQIHDLQDQVDGTNNLIVISALIDKLSNPEAEVRQAVLDTLKQMNDTNAVPGLERAAESIKDAREKVAVLDTIDYIKLPSATENVPTEFLTNAVHTVRTDISTNVNPAFLKGNNNIKLRKHGQQPSAPNTPANQPQ